jgi:NAD(P)-dependent dehydrogenase (short-subunit alcohol dehydrogenase family)
MAIRFDDKVVIVTGAGGGLGRAHALGFAARGAIVVVNDLAGSDAVVAEIVALGGRALADATSVTDRAGMAALVARLVADHGHVDVLIANAGFLRDKSFAKMSETEWDEVVAVHLGGAEICARAVWPTMRERGGRIVFTSSGSGLYGNFGQANYAAAKMALVGLTKTLAAEGAKAGIHVNALAPVAWTRLTANLFPPDSEALFAPEKVTPAALFLASAGAPNGMVLSAGAGVFAEVRVLEAEGLALADADLSPEAVAAGLATIADMARAVTPRDSIEQTFKLAARAARN